MVGVAQIWPQNEPVPIPIIVTVVSDGSTTDVPAPILPLDDARPTPEEATPPPEPDQTPPPDDTPPPNEEPEMMLDTPQPTPTPGPIKRSRFIAPAGPLAPNLNRSNHPQSGVAGGLSNAARTSGALPIKTAGIWQVSSKPPYPFQARTSHLVGSGSIRLTTDASGKVASASVSQSSGSAVLDGAIMNHAKLNWSGPSNATTTVPFTFRLP